MAVDAVAVVGPENNEVQSADPCAAFATELHGKVAEQARRRQVIEQRWYEDTRQYYGFYDEETEKRLEDEKGSSKLFVNLTRPKTRVMRARLNDILFPNDEPNPRWAAALEGYRPSSALDKRWGVPPLPQNLSKTIQIGTITYTLTAMFLPKEITRPHDWS